jgi:hypothetical protein
VREGADAAIDEYAGRQTALKTIEKERDRRAVRRRKAARAVTRWEPGYVISGGKSGCEVELTSWSAMSGLNEVGYVHKTSWTGKTVYEWRVHNRPAGCKEGGECSTLDKAKAEVEKRVERWFRDCGIDRSRLQ